jgi:hypothetical protein
MTDSGDSKGAPNATGELGSSPALRVSGIGYQVGWFTPPGVYDDGQEDILSGVTVNGT